MSFALTTPQVLARKKTVTRRVGWAFLKPGDLIQAIEKGQGLKKGEHVRKLAVLRVTSVDREFITEICEEANESYGCAEVVAEGFPDLSPEEFVTMFIKTHPAAAHQRVTRIEFEYLDGEIA